MSPSLPLDVRVLRGAAALAIGLTLAAVLAAAMLWVAQRPQFDFRRIEIRTADGSAPRHVTEAALRAALRGRLRGNFFTMNLTQARHAFEEVPWVAQVSVRRVWPARLVVTIREHQAIGLWNDGRVLSNRGRLFAANAAEAELDGPLVSFSGPPGFAEAAALRWRDLTDVLTPLALAVRAIEVNERASWTVSTVTPQGAGPVLELGRDDPPGRLRERVTAVAAAWPTVLTQLERVPTRIDARYANGFTAAPARPVGVAASRVQAPPR